MTESKTRDKRRKKKPCRGLFGYVEEWSYLLYGRNHIVFYQRMCLASIALALQSSHTQTARQCIYLKITPFHSGLPEEAQNSSQLLPLLPSFLSSPLPFFCQPPLLCSSQRVKEGKVMSGPPGLHCVLALCHCIACRPQTHVQETFLHSQ